MSVLHLLPNINGIALARKTSGAAMAALLCSCMGCSKLLPFTDNSIPSVEEGLPGVWQSTEFKTSTGEFMVRDASTGLWHNLNITPETETITKDSDYYSIIKFTATDITLLAGGKCYHAELANPYSYYLKEDSIMMSPLFGNKFSDDFVYVTDMTKNSFRLVTEMRGTSVSGDTTCISASASIAFRRLR